MGRCHFEIARLISMNIIGSPAVTTAACVTGIIDTLYPGGRIHPLIVRK